jgi:hypothetical protein
MDILFIWVVFMLVFMALAYLLGERGAAAARGEGRHLRETID